MAGSRRLVDQLDERGTRLGGEVRVVGVVVMF